MMTIIAALGRNGALGVGNKLPWHLPADMRHFRSLTTGHPVVMGRKTYESIGRALPNRTNIVVSRRKDWFQEGILIVGTLKEALKFAKKLDEEYYIIGGADLYAQTVPLADRMELTFVEAEIPADVFFPKIDKNLWEKTAETRFPADEAHAYPYTFSTWVRRNPQSGDNIPQ